jgi:ribokinase
LKLCPLVVIKKGANGALGQIVDHEVIQLPALRTSMVDTTGAGDAFAAGFLPTWLESQNLEAAMLAGIFQATKCVSVIGARPLVATR